MEFGEFVWLGKKDLEMVLMRKKDLNKEFVAWISGWFLLWIVGLDQEMMCSDKVRFRNMLKLANATLLIEWFGNYVLPELTYRGFGVRWSNLELFDSVAESASEDRNEKVVLFRPNSYLIFVYYCIIYCELTGFKVLSIFPCHCLYICL